MWTVKVNYGNVKLLIGKLMLRCYVRECLLNGRDFVFLDVELKLQVFDWKPRYPWWMWYSISVTCVPLLCNWYYVCCACHYLFTATSCGQYGQHFLSVSADYSNFLVQFTLVQLRTELDMGMMMSIFEKKQHENIKSDICWTSISYLYRSICFNRISRALQWSK